MRVDPLDHFAVKLEHEAQHAVRRRMLRPEVDREVTEVVLFVHLFGRAGSGRWWAIDGSRQWAIGSRQ